VTVVIGSGRASSGQGPVCDRCGRVEPNRYRFCPDCELFVCAECWDPENGVCLSSSRPNLPAPGLLPISIKNTIGQRPAGVSLSASRVGQALVGPAAQADAPVATRPPATPAPAARHSPRRMPASLLAVLVASLLITLALFALPALAGLFSGDTGVPASHASASPATTSRVEGATKAARRYVVRAGDTLRSIAARLYGDERRWSDLYQANRKAIDNPDALDVGTTLTVP
jgi:hypothetical protein